MTEVINISDAPKIELCECTRCGFKWYPRTPEKPKTCANQKCRSGYWDRPRVRKQKKE